MSVGVASMAARFSTISGWLHVVDSGAVICDPLLEKGSQLQTDTPTQTPRGAWNHATGTFKHSNQACDVTNWWHYDACIYSYIYRNVTNL